MIDGAIIFFPIKKEIRKQREKKEEEEKEEKKNGRRNWTRIIRIRLI